MGGGAAEEAHPPVPLRVEPGRHAFPGHLGDRGRVRGPFCHVGSQVEAVSTQRGWSGAAHTASAVSPARLPEDGPVARPSGKAPGESKLPVRELTERALLQQYAPAGALVNEHGDILYLHGRTGQYLEPAPGEAGMNILKMAREGLRPRLDHRPAQSGGAQSAGAPPGPAGQNQRRFHDRQSDGPAGARGPGFRRRGQTVPGHFRGRAGAGPATVRDGRRLGCRRRSGRERRRTSTRALRR